MMRSSPQLLVSVRDAREALSAVRGGADIIDVKEPARGPLGGATAGVLREIAETIGDAKPLSAALGELVAAEETIEWAALAGFQWAKLGLAECSGDSQWLVRWMMQSARLPRGCKLVAVAYADFEKARSPAPMEVAQALAGKYSVFLIDTFEKKGETLLEATSRGELLQLRQTVVSQGAQFAIAGSLRSEQIAELLNYGADIIGIRGAACDGGRQGAVSETRVSDFRISLHRALSSSETRMQPCLETISAAQNSCEESA